MDPEELELQNDYRYRNYAAVIEKALRNFESSSEWADLISSLGKLNKALQSNLRYSLLPKRLIIGKRLAQCLHPALPSGVHLKALETYEVIFKIIGTKWLAKDLFIYSSGLFPLLGHAAMAVKPVLLTLYERYYLPLQRALLPSLQAFITGLLPGLEEGLEVYDRTDALMVKLSLLVGQQVFYGALWGSVLVSPMVRLPATIFLVSHFDRMESLHQQTHMLGYDHRLVIKSVCLSLQDSNVLVQRNMLEIVLYFFPLATCLEPTEASIAVSPEDMITMLSAASLTLLRRDMSLNRRLYGWLLGTDIKGGMVTPHPTFSTTAEEHTTFYFNSYSRDFLVQALISILKQKSDPENVTGCLRPFRIIMSLLDKPEIGPVVLSSVLLEVVRAFYIYCREMVGEETITSSGLSGNQLASKIKENKNASEVIKTMNMLVSSMNSEYLWEYMTRRFCTALSYKDDPPMPPQQDRSHPAPTVAEMSNLIIFLLDVLPLELHTDIQSQFLPEMLGTMLRTLSSHIHSVSLEDVTQGLRACFKVLSKIQMPMAYMDIEAGAHIDDMETQLPEEESTKTEVTENEAMIDGAVGQVNGHYGDEELNRDGEDEGAPAGGIYPTLRSEDSGLGISASPSEQQLPPGLGQAAGENGMCKEGEGVWRRGGSVDSMTQCLQDILAFITTRYLLVQVEDVRGPEEVPQPDVAAALMDQKTSLPAIEGREIKDKLTELFTPSKLKPCSSSDNQPSVAPIEKKKEKGCLNWAAGYMPRGKAEISESCRQAFTATCHLLLECTTFPVYLSEEETLALHTDMFGNTGSDVDSLPVWLRSLMTLCCLSRDYNIQHTAVASLLELINHSQSLALVIEDKHRRYQTSDSNPLSGCLQMVTVPPIYPAVLRAIEEGTDFFQRVSRVLWSQLDTERREQHISCVELFYRLHCLAPSASICEDIICQALLHKDKSVRLEALHRFTVLWHLTREIQNNRTMSLNRSFDRSLCVVVDSLSCTDGSISAAAQCWLVRALSLNDVIRILEPILLLLLHPSTQRCSIQSVKQSLSAGDLKVQGNRSRSSTKTSGTCADSMATEVTTLNLMNIVDREALWAELDSGAEASQTPDTLAISRSESEETEEENKQEEEEEEEAESEHTESADTSGAQVSNENSSSGSTPYRSTEEGSVVNGLRRAESERTQASDSLSSEDEEDLELEAIARSRLLKQERERREAIDSLFRHMLLYPAAGGWRHLLQGLALLDSLLRSSAECPLVDALSSTSLDTSSAAHLNLVSNLLQRHQQAQDGKGFYGALLSPSSSPSFPPSLLIELLVSLCLRFLRSQYPSYLSLGPLDLQGNREVQVKSVEVLTHIVNQLCCMVRGHQGNGANLDPIRRLLSGCKVQQYALLTLSASMYISQKGTDKGPPKGVEVLDEQGGLSEESLVNVGSGGGQEQFTLQMELLKLLQALIVLEYHIWPGGAISAAGSGGASGQSGEPRETPTASTPLAREWQTAVLFQQSIKAAQYVQSHPITAQGMFVSAAARALQPQYGYAMHPHWVSLLVSSLPYLGRSLGIIVAPLISQICRNLDELVKLYEHDGGKTNQSLSGRRENIAPDYPLTLLEGLTSITHHCLLDNKRSLVACDPVDVRNARNAVVEELPHMLSSMALLWGVVMREELQRRASDSAQSSRHSSTSVYFKSTKILRQRILEFLVPLTLQYGVQLMASLGAVWSKRKSKRRHKNKVLPVASESRLTIVDLVKSLHTLHTDTILQLVKEVVKKPHQIKGEQKATLVDIPMLQFSFAYIQSVSAQALQENVAPLLSLLRESVQLNLAPPGHFLLLGILNDFVNRLPNLDNKKDSKDLQEVTQRILEAVGGIAGSSLEQTSWLSRSLEVKVQPQVCAEAEDGDDADIEESMAQANAMVSSSAPSVYSVQALVLLAEVLAPLLDMVYRSDEKEKAVPLISRLMYYVFPYLKNHSAYNMPSFEAGSQLLSSLSGYAYTKRAWKKEVFELFMDPLFFTMETSCAPSWKSIVDHLLTHEKTMFKDLMSMQSSSLKLFANVDQKPMLLKRQAFAMFSGEQDQYHLYLPLIQERLTETLRLNPSPAVSAQMFLMFRVLLLRISSQHLTSLWPIMVTELIRTFTRLEKTLQTEKDVSKLAKVVRSALDRNGPVNFTQAELDMYLSACKFLDTSLAFPPEKIPLFQMYRWAFVPEVDVDRYSGPVETALIEGEQECIPHVVKILEGIQQRFGTLNGLSEESSTEYLEFPLLTQCSLSSITQLLPFLRILCCSFQGPPPYSDSMHHFPVADYPASSSEVVLKRLEKITEEEFLDSLES
ncbi:protein dopey-2 [Cheilinus undulatus]|uniref:protein dopey-2 n=1 Tax=Cheilinus undulatus TaxID=241271 RepID=UPI001BD36440|nr:protein dopey-2 [Cheilinus undulatus]XP_041663674.1 protein dopey-2 [Cheilinus undulatus]XP_041663675.1 protein dopey-2 [Cheilinus undulatus]